MFNLFEVTGCFCKSQNGFKRLVKVSTLFGSSCYSYTIFPPLLHLNNAVIHFHIAGHQYLACTRVVEVLISDQMVFMDAALSVWTPAVGGWVITELVQICCLSKCCLYEERAILQLDPCLFVLNDIFLQAYSELLMLLTQICLCRNVNFPNTNIIDFNLFCWFGKYYTFCEKYCLNSITF